MPSLARQPDPTAGHGTRAGYRRGCHCEPCRQAGRDYARHRYRLIAYGRWQPFTDAAPVRDHVRRLMARGIGANRIAVLAAVSPGAVGHLLYGDPARGEPPSRRIRTATAQRLLAVRFTKASLAPGAVMDAAGTRRRLQALIATGWSGRALAARLGMGTAHLHRILRGRPAVTAATACRVRDLYDQLWDQLPPESSHGERISVAKARAHAARNAWPPPLAWDDDMIDDPDACPGPWQRTTLRPSRDLAAEAAELASRGYTRTQAAERLGVSRNTLDKAISRAAHEKGRAA
ncbi:MAG: helix-turn-helix domain-containing protein [Actinobacteria bacterium]|nr:helix-turn-helix domain-containing protein [Actinomycetota bacterium]